jgi:hypothetical protein
MIPVTPLSNMSEMLGSSQLRARTSTGMPQPSPTCAIWPMVSSENSECWPSMKTKSCPVVLAMRTTSPERASRTIMPSATSPACMRAFTGLTGSGSSAGGILVLHQC